MNDERRISRKRRPSLHGLWLLQACIETDSDGMVRYPFGTAPKGILQYHLDGRVFVVMAATDRPRFQVPDPRAGADAEIRAAFEGYVSYAGTFVILPGSVVEHRIEVSLFPNWEGATLRRHFSLKHDLLTIRTEPMQIESRAIVSEIRWMRDDRGRTR